MELAAGCHSLKGRPLALLGGCRLVLGSARGCQQWKYELRGCTRLGSPWAMSWYKEKVIGRSRARYVMAGLRRAVLLQYNSPPPDGRACIDSEARFRRT